jgi:Uma2 family endonuclease
MAAQTARWQWTVADYARMREAGILAEDDRVELIDGEVRPMSPIGPLHAAIVKRLNEHLSGELRAKAIVSVQDPIQLDDYSEPQPDLAVLRQRDDFYAGAHPRAADVLLVIEVADTSLGYDRDEKLPRYAAALIPEVWLVDIGSLLVEQYSQPRHGRYSIRRILAQSDLLASATIPGFSIAVADIFG